MKSYELVYGNGGHGGPYWGIENARGWAIQLLRSSSTETAIYIVPRSALHYSSQFAVERVFKRTDSAIVSEPVGEGS
jgi:hypothetical protein